MTDTRLLLVRHAQSTWNCAGRWQGQEDPPLSSRGLEQARRAAEVLRSWRQKFQLVASSDLARAKQTAVLIAGALDLPEPLCDRRLRERFAGPWQGLTREEIERGWPGWLRDGRRPEDFETDDELVARVSAAVAELAGGADLVLVVTHGGVIRALERRAGVHAEPLANLEGRWFTSRGGRLDPGERIRLAEDGRAGPPPPEL